MARTFVTVLVTRFCVDRRERLAGRQVVHDPEGTPGSAAMAKCYPS